MAIVNECDLLNILEVTFFIAVVLLFRCRSIDVDLGFASYGHKQILPTFVLIKQKNYEIALKSFNF